HAHAAYELRTVPDGVTTMEPAVRPRATKIFTTDGLVPPRMAVVWFEHPAAPGKFLLSRAVGVPGDRISVRSGRTWRNGKAVPEDHAESRVELEELAEVIVPDGYVFLMNDNRGEAGSAALDSRRLGLVPVALVAGWQRDAIADRE